MSARRSVVAVARARGGRHAGRSAAAGRAARAHGAPLQPCQALPVVHVWQFASADPKTRRSDVERGAGYEIFTVVREFLMIRPGFV